MLSLGALLQIIHNSEFGNPGAPSALMVESELLLAWSVSSKLPSLSCSREVNEFVDISEPISDVWLNGFSSYLGFFISKSDKLLSDMYRLRLFFVLQSSELVKLLDLCDSSLKDCFDVVDELEGISDVPDFTCSTVTTISSVLGELKGIISWLEPIPESCERLFSADLRFSILTGSFFFLELLDFLLPRGRGGKNFFLS